MATREAACSCGQLRLAAAGDPVRISMCHCLACQRRTGSAFAIQARFPADDVRVTGRFTDYLRVSDDGEERLFRFCPECGATVFYTTPDAPEVIAVPVGAFADPSFPPPTVSVYGSRRHPWVDLPDGIETEEVWESLRPLYEAGEYAQVADRARDLIAAHPEFAVLHYNVACCESLAGRTGDAIDHLRRAIDRTPYFRRLAAGDTDFDPIRGEPAFAELVG
jgi:hypothetical protein